MRLLRQKMVHFWSVITFTGLLMVALITLKMWSLFVQIAIGGHITLVTHKTSMSS